MQNAQPIYQDYPVRYPFNSSDQVYLLHCYMETNAKSARPASKWISIKLNSYNETRGIASIELDCHPAAEQKNSSGHMNHVSVTLSLNICITAAFCLSCVARLCWCHGVCGYQWTFAQRASGLRIIEVVSYFTYNICYFCTFLLGISNLCSVHTSLMHVAIILPFVNTASGLTET